jgi:long-chain acyl-CoA synthetase
VSSRLLASVERHARERPDALAVREISGEGDVLELGWRALRDAAWRLAETLRSSGEEGAVLIAAPSGARLLTALLGGLQAGRPVLPIAPDVPEAHALELARRASAGVAIAQPPLLPALARAVARTLPLASIGFEQGGAPARRTSSGSGGSLYLQSSGSTGLPKLVCRSAAALDAVGAGCGLALGIAPQDRLAIPIPLHHSYGIDLALLAGVSAGCTIELHARFVPSWLRGALAAGGVTVLPAVPLIFDVLARGGAPVPKLRRAVSAGSPLPLAVFERFREAFGVAIGQLYGATEFGSVTYNPPERAGFDPESAGLPLAGVELRVIDVADGSPERALATGSEGQLAVRSASMLSHYVGDPEPPTTRDGFFVTGDLGRLDASGSLTLSGRAHFLIDVGGRKVNPLEVESVLMRHPGVREAVVVPVRLSETVARLKAVIVPSELAPSGEELRRFARDHLVHYKVPRSFEIRTDVPRSPTGKILRHALR